MQSSGALAQAGTGIEAIPMLIDGTWGPGIDLCEVRTPYRGSVRALAPQSSLADLDDASVSATKGKRVAAAMRAYERAALLRRVGALISERAGSVAEIIAREM
jgi:acyl-CoA reductase-like NAD-dependent aldehyde dehydrogenase